MSVGCSQKLCVKTGSLQISPYKAHEYMDLSHNWFMFKSQITYKHLYVRSSHKQFTFMTG